MDREVVIKYLDSVIDAYENLQNVANALPNVCLCSPPARFAHNELHFLKDDVIMFANALETPLTNTQLGTSMYHHFMYKGYKIFGMTILEDKV